jgi:raffinose/stachyose/melibiose transport system substrate-binding protein
VNGGAADMERRLEHRSRIRNCVGLGILLAALAWSVVHVSIHSFGPESDSAVVAGKKIIRFAHWQLEGRCVEALNEACREYERLPKHRGQVVVQQIEVPERAYEQWTRTQLIGRTAPDLIELRWWQDLVVRYFMPLSDVVEQPNPYNEDDPNLTGLPWRETYVDNMMGGWNGELRDYYGMPLSLFTVRVYANKALMKQAAGVTEPPKTLGQFVRICQRIQQYAHQRRRKEPGFRLVPIAGSQYTENIFRGRYWQISTWGLLEEYDENCDGWFDEAERIEAILTGRLDLANDPHIRAGHRVLYDLSRYFNPGFMAAQRDDSVFYFSRGNAAMIATGTWDAGSLWREVGGDFEIMVFDFPIPAPDEKYGQYIRHRLTEAGDRAGFSFGLTRFTKHRDLAIDFMRFLTSRRQNEKLNQAFRWFPAIRGARPDPILEAFRPEGRGIYGVFSMEMKGDTQLRYFQKYNSYISEVDPEPKDYEAFLAAARGDREAFQGKYGLLAERMLKRLGDKAVSPANYPFDQYIEDWRDDHCQRFLASYAADYHELALADFHRNYVDSYHRIVQAESAIALARAKAMRHGLQPGIRRGLASVVLGQVSKTDDRVRFHAVYEKVKAMKPPGPQGAAEGGR